MCARTAMAEKKVERDGELQAPPRSIDRFTIEFEFTEMMLASSPADAEVYARFIASRREKEAGPDDEIESLPTDERAGWSVFHQDETGIFIFNYKIKGFLKAAAEAMTGKQITAYKSKIDKWIWVQPRKLYLTNPAGEVLKKPSGVYERPLRAMTMQGPRVSVKRSDYVDAGTRCVADIIVLPLGQRDLKTDVLELWLSYGQFGGIGERRNDGFGNFKWRYL